MVKFKGATNSNSAYLTINSDKDVPVGTTIKTISDLKNTFNILDYEYIKAVNIFPYYNVALFGFAVYVYGEEMMACMCDKTDPQTSEVLFWGNVKTEGAEITVIGKR